jgi:hypothetical protein
MGEETNQDHPNDGYQNSDKKLSEPIPFMQDKLCSKSSDQTQAGIGKKSG